MISRALSAWVVVDALIFALLLSQARGFVLAAGAIALMALWVVIFALCWSAFLPIIAGAAVLRRLGLIGAAR